MEIELANGKGIVVIDESDYQLVTQYSWHIHVAGTKTYARAWINGKRVYMHRLLCNGELVDHINQNGLDNRRDNLRAADRSLNAVNSAKRKDNSTGYRGVTFNKNANKYMAEIKRNGVRKYLGLFDTAEEAAQAYLTASESM